MRTVAEALAMIPKRRNALNHVDDVLMRVIQHVESALQSLRPGVSAMVSYETQEGPTSLSFGKVNMAWRICYGVEGGPLAAASRLARAAVFTPNAQGTTPIELLIIAVVDALEQNAQERSPQLAAAQRLTEVLETAGFPRPAD